MLPTSAFARALREAAPSLSKRFFHCSGRTRGVELSGLRPVNPKTKTSAASIAQIRNLTTKHARSTRHLQSAQTPSRARVVTENSPATSRFVRAFSASSQTRATAAATESPQAKSEDNGNGEAGGEKRRSTKSSFPETSSNAVAYWLLGSAASVFGIVVFGGLTRLTESGYVTEESHPCGPGHRILTVLTARWYGPWLTPDCFEQVKHHGMETSHRFSSAHV